MCTVNMTPSTYTSFSFTRFSHFKSLACWAEPVCLFVCLSNVAGVGGLIERVNSMHCGVVGV